MITLDWVLDNRIQMGTYQIGQFAILALVDFMDGFSFIFLAVLLSILKSQWDLSQSQITILGSTYFIGIASGQLLQGLYSDRFGRKVLLTYSMGLMIITLVAHLFIYHFMHILILRIIFGILFGVSLPLGQIILCEQVPSPYRGRTVALLQVFFIAGILYFLLTSSLFLKNFTEGNWQGMIIFNIFPTLICYLGCVFKLEESARFDLTKCKFTEGFILINKMGLQNQGSCYVELTSSDKDELVVWSNQIRRFNSANRNIKDLFTHGRALITITLWLMMILWSIQSIGTMILLPFLLSTSGHGFNSLLLAHSMELVAIVICYSVIDRVSIGGRKMTLYFSICLYMMAQLSLFYRREEGIIVAIMTIRFADRMIWTCMHQAKMECYSTYYRTLGTGTSQFFGFSGAAAAPFFLFPLFYIDPYLPFLIIGLISIPFLIAAIIHPVNATNKILDDLETLEKQY